MNLAALNGATSTSFAYDATGRRRAKTTSGTITLLYDGANVAQELVGGSPTANVSSGDIDEVFQRAEGTGLRSVLTDALGSTVALLDASGAVQTQYTYEPFGAPSRSVDPVAGMIDRRLRRCRGRRPGSTTRGADEAPSRASADGRGTARREARRAPICRHTCRGP